MSDNLLKHPTDLNSVSIETPRLDIRSVRLGDEQLMFLEITKELTQHWIGWEPPSSSEDLRYILLSSMGKSRETLNISCIAFSRDANEFVGCCAIAPTKERDFEVNLWVKKTAQGKGYAGEMLDAMIGWARKHTKLAYLVYSVTDGNIPSQKLIGKYNAHLLRTWTAEKRGNFRLVRDYMIDLKFKHALQV